MKAVCLYCITAAYKQQTITYHGVFWLIPIYKITIMLTFYDKINAKVQDSVAIHMIKRPIFTRTFMWHKSKNVSSAQ